MHRAGNLNPLLSARETWRKRHIYVYREAQSREDLELYQILFMCLQNYFSFKGVPLCTQDGNTNIPLHNTIWTWFGKASLYLCVPLRWSSSLWHWDVRAGTFSPPGAACPSRSGSHCADTERKAEPSTFASCQIISEGITFYIMHIMRKARFRWPKLYEEEIRGALANGKGQESVDTPEMWSNWAYTVRTIICWDVEGALRGMSVSHYKGMGSHYSFNTGIKGTS